MWPLNSRARFESSTLDIVSLRQRPPAGLAPGRPDEASGRTCSRRGRRLVCPAERSSASSLCSGHRHHYIVENPRAAPYFLNPDPFIIAVLAAALCVSCGVGSESVGIDTQRPVALVLCVSAGETRHYRHASKILA